jgi:hypothetical protein
LGKKFKNYWVASDRFIKVDAHEFGTDRSR